MPQKRHTVDQIVAKLRKADVELGKGKKVPEICKLLAITEQTDYRWRQKYRGMKPEMAKKLNALEKENSRLKTTGHSRRIAKVTPIKPASHRVGYNNGELNTMIRRIRSEAIAMADSFCC